MFESANMTLNPSTSCEKKIKFNVFIFIELSAVEFVYLNCLLVYSSFQPLLSQLFYHGFHSTFEQRNRATFTFKFYITFQPHIRLE